MNYGQMKRLGAFIFAIAAVAAASKGLSEVVWAAKVEQRWGGGIFFGTLTFCLSFLVINLLTKAPEGE